MALERKKEMMIELSGWKKTSRFFAQKPLTYPAIGYDESAGDSLAVYPWKPNESLSDM